LFRAPHVRDDALLFGALARTRRGVEIVARVTSLRFVAKTLAEGFVPVISWRAAQGELTPTTAPWFQPNVWLLTKLEGHALAAA